MVSQGREGCSHQEKGRHQAGSRIHGIAGLKHRWACRQPAFTCQRHAFFYEFSDSGDLCVWRPGPECILIWKGLYSLGNFLSSFIFFLIFILFLWRSRNQPKVRVVPESEALVNTEREGCVCLLGHTVRLDDYGLLENSTQLN